jgi:tetratricopeptide (TPR) repeat protein
LARGTAHAFSLSGPVLALVALAGAGCSDSRGVDDRGAADPSAREGGTLVTGEMSPITFAEHVAPILYEHCASCHRLGESAPFSLVRYEDVKPIAERVAEAVATRRMPPWLPEPGYAKYESERRLSDEQVEVIRRWAASGAPEGDPSSLPPAPAPEQGWRLGEPGLVVRMPEPYTVPADGPDIFRNFVIPLPLSGTRYVRTIELRPGGAGVVHHAQLAVDRTGAARRRDAEDPSPGFDGMVHAGGIEAPDGFFLGWTPGKAPFPGYEGLAWRADGRSDLVLMLHLRPQGAPRKVQAEIALHFADRPPERYPVLVKLSRPDLDIPAGATEYTAEDSYTLPVDVEALSVYPHAHFLGARVEGYAVLPDGRRRWLVRIGDWDFNWQDEYRFAEPIFLPGGTRVVMRWTYDNSAENPRNPSRPPVRVVYGPRSSDEMGELMIEVLPRDVEDRAALLEDLGRKELRWRVTLYRHLLRLEPASADHHYDLGIALQALGRLDEAVDEYRRALELDPSRSETHNNLGTALQAQGRVDQALTRYRRALELDAANASAHLNLGNLLQGLGRPGDAVAHLERAVELRPDLARAHASLGYGLAAVGRLAEAVDHWRRAIRLEPDWPVPRLAAAWALATAPDPALHDPAEGLALAERAAELTRRQDPMVLDALAAALAASGRFEQAAATAEEAYWLALSRGADRLAVEIRARRDLYSRGRVYRTPGR